MDEASRKAEAARLFQLAYQLQMSGQLLQAIEYYQRSIAVRPTAEAHTFLGWTYSFLGQLELAIAECRKAIEIDPEFGNPWNDIGAYLIEQGKEDEAIPYLQRAIQAVRYESYCFPHFNLSRVYLKKGMLRRAKEELELALQANPEFRPAAEVLEELRTRLN